MTTPLSTLLHLTPPGLAERTGGGKASGRKSRYLLPFLFLLTGLLSLPAFAQVTPQYFHAGGTGSNAFPFNTNSVKRSQHLYLPGDLPNAVAGNIIRIYVKAANAGTAGTYTDFRLRLGQTTATAFPGTNSDEFFTNLTPVITSASFTLPAQTVDAWVPIDLTIPFLFNPAQTLVVEFEMSAGSGGFSVRTSTGPAAPAHKRLTATTLTATTGSASTIWTDFGIDVGPSTPCSGAPTAGTAVSSVSTVCPNTNFNLSLTGNTFATGITHQWQSSPDGIIWTDITGATNPFLTRNQTTTTFYRAVLTCSGVSSNSASVQVTTNSTPTSGTFTINKNGLPGGTNFLSFASAINSFACGGLNGAIVFNVVAGSGPYNEQVVIPTIPGASATNTITFNGNANTLIGTSVTGDVIKLDGADFVKFDNLKIEAMAAATGGALVNLTNGANSNIFSNNTLTHSTTNTTVSYGFWLTGASSNNTISNNTITGAYYGINNAGTSATALNSSNTFTNNTLKDQYFYGVLTSFTSGNLYEGNDISRPTRTNGTLFYGINIGGNSTLLVVSKNRIHNTNDAAPATAGTVYGIYSSATGAAGNENIIKNNAIYNINNTGGTFYGLYNSASSGTYYFHNTVSADLAGVSYATVRGMYFTSASTNVKFQNNNISLSNPATGKHALYLASSTIALTSNGNNLYAPNGNVGYYSGDKATLADWKLVNTNAYDQNSVSANPQFANLATGNLMPTSGILNNIGTPVTPPVADDITGAARPVTPDPGAFEFTPSANDVGVLAIVTPVSGCGKTNAEIVTITIQNFGSATQSNIPVTYTINGGAPVTAIFPGPLAAGAVATYSFTVPANLSATGTYTFVASTNLATDAQAGNNAVTKVVTTIPTISTLPYSENFENGPGGWIAGGANSSWAFGTPAKAIINSAASGTKAWVTNLTGQYNASEQSFVNGPCFNFATVADPDFEMKAWWNSEFSWDGAVLQSSIDGGATWQLVGNFGDPNNWYTDNTVNGAPGGQTPATAVAWTGRASTSNGSGGWVSVKHKLTGLGGKSSVLLRIAFGSDASVLDDGFAFDDIRIGDNTGNLAINSFVPLNKICGFTSTEPVEVVIENQGSVPVPASNFTLEFRVDAGAWIPQAPTSALAAGTPTHFIFNQTANLSNSGSHTIDVRIVSAGDPDMSNNTIAYTISNATFPSLPISLDFETPASGVAAMRAISQPKANITEGTGASSPLGATSTKGMIMDGVTDATWITPGGATDPWSTNLTHHAAAYICFNPSGGAASDSLWLTFDLKQLYKTAAANTNFRITVNGVQEGPTYRPPFDPTNPATPIVWKHYKIDLFAFKNLTGLQIGLESSVKEEYANGTGPANLLDNIMVVRRLVAGPTGMKENTLASQLTVFPNPSNGLFNVSLPAGKAYNLEVTDLTGKVIRTQKANGETQLKLDNTAKGIYLLKVTSEGATTVKKLIVE
jgi:hypothetical protein